MDNRFLARAEEGESSWTRQMAAIAVTWVGFFLVGLLPILIPVYILSFSSPASAEAILNDLSAFHLLGLHPLLLFCLLMLEFVIGLGALWAGVVFIQKRLLQSLVTGFARIRWRRMMLGALVWSMLLGLYAALQYGLDPSSIRLNSNSDQLLLFLVPALLLVPIQCAFEEIAIRGQLLQALHRLFPRFLLIPALLTALLFASLHLSNPEVSRFGPGIMLTYYFTFGFFLALIAIHDEGLELAIGVHTGNNLFLLLLFSYPDAAVQTPALFVRTSVVPEYDLLALIMMCLAFSFAFFPSIRSSLQKIGRNKR
ncbi:MAG: CPBP family intramembrane glutamic endopeptidase [Bacteroidota bacterium]